MKSKEKSQEKKSRHRYSEGAVLPRRNRGGWYYHPFEISVSGFSGSGKTTLISALIRRFRENGISPAYIKHDAHRFVMDREGKDTWRAFEAGAQAVFIRDRTHNAVITDGDFDQAAAEQSILRSDCLFIEGNKHSDIPKLFMLDSDNEGIELLREGPGDPSVIAAAGPPALLKHVPAGMRTVDRDDIEGIYGLITEHFCRARPPLYGLVLMGGRSERMGRDKAALVYRGVSQAERALGLIRERCERCFFSVRPSQNPGPGVESAVREKSAELIPDRFLELGPMGGILSAQSVYPGAAWLVLGVDLPLLRGEDIDELLSFRNPLKFASCFGTNRSRRGELLDYLLPEPLCAVYEPKSYARMLALLGRGIECPRAFLRASDTVIQKPEREEAAFNANSPEQRTEALLRLEGDGDAGGPLNVDVGAGGEADGVNGVDGEGE